MVIIKYISLILIFGCSTIIGISLGKKFKYRVNELRELKNTINILETKIKFTYEPLGEIFNDIVNILGKNNNISKIFQRATENMKNFDANQSWIKAIEDTKVQLNLNKEDISIVKDLGKLLR